MRIIFRLLGYLGKYRLLLLGAYACLFLSTAFSLATPHILGESIDAVLEEKQLFLLVIAAAVIIALSMIRGAFAYGQSYLSESIGQKIAYDLRNALYDHLQRLSFSYHDRQQTGQLMSRATADVEGVRWFLSMGVVRGVYLVILFLLIAAVLFSINWTLALVTLVTVPVVSARAVQMNNQLRGIWLNVQVVTGELGTILQESLSGIRVVKAFAREEFEKAKFRVKAEELARESFEAAKVQAFNSPLMNLLFTVTLGVILWLGGREVIEGRLTPGEITKFVFYVQMLLMPARMVGMVVNMVSRAVSSGQRIFEVLDAMPEVKEKPRALALERAQGSVSFERVSFSYDSRVPALKDITFDAAPGQVVALLGSTGSGKTTVVHLIPRFYDVTQGRITIDGIDIRETTLQSLRDNVGIVHQDVFMFSATIRDNIAYGRTNASLDEVTQAAKTAGLHDFIVGLPEGYGTWVGERGITLSGGQKQRLAIARTLLKNPKILIMDDSTSSVDTETEHQIQRALRDLIVGRTTFVVAQRLSTVKSADLILVLQDGQIVERGRHEELLTRSGIYRQLYDLQLRPQEEALPAGRS